eukprot:4760841-Amphidinium_carterae.1
MPRAPAHARLLHLQYSHLAPLGSITHTKHAILYSSEADTSSNRCLLLTCTKQPVQILEGGPAPFQMTRAYVTSDIGRSRHGHRSPATCELLRKCVCVMKHMEMGEKFSNQWDSLPRFPSCQASGLLSLISGPNSPCLSELH